MRSSHSSINKRETQFPKMYTTYTCLTENSLALYSVFPYNEILPLPVLQGNLDPAHHHCHLHLHDDGFLMHDADLNSMHKGQIFCNLKKKELFLF